MDALLALTNGRAGRAGDRSESSVLATLRREADLTVANVATPDELRSALNRHPDRHPVVLGGDGSVHQVVAALHEFGQLESRIVGLVPMGTGNDLARTLGLPLAPEAAARVVLAGTERRLDLLVDDHGGVVVNAVHLGVGADAARRATALKPGLGQLAYTAGALAAGVRTRGWRLRVTVDDEVLADGTRRVLMVGVSNGTTIGGGTPLGPRAVPDDGLADVFVSTSTGPIARLRFGAQLAHGRHHGRSDVASARGRRVLVSGEPAPVNVDGELITPRPERGWTVQPSAVRIRAPG